MGGDEASSWDISTLMTQHSELLRASAIDVDVARERKYVSADTKAQLERHGFAQYQRRVPGLIIPMWSVEGKVFGWQYRPDNPRTRKSKAIKYETPTGQRLGLDVHPRIQPSLGDPSVDLWITEGARKADAAITKGLACMSIAGVYGWRGKNSLGGLVASPDFEYIAWNGRRVVLAFDSDVVDKKPVREALGRLCRLLEQKGARVDVLRIPAAENGDKVGLDDWFASGQSIEKLERCVDPSLVAIEDDDDKKSQATKVFDFANERYIFCRSAEGEAFAHEPKSHAALLVRSGELRASISNAWRESSGNVVSTSALRDAIEALNGQVANYEATDLYLRFGETPNADAVVVDLANNSDAAVRVDGSGWLVVSDPGVLFRRSKLTQALPDPDDTCGLEGLKGLRDLLNVSDEDWFLILGWLVMPLVRPLAPHPILAMRGEQGTGKTTAAKLLAKCIDPSPSPIRRSPDDETHWRTSLAGSRVCVFDNLSWVKPWLSDAMCRAVTGDAEVTRQLYTDDSLIVHELRRSIIVTTIDAAFMRGDLADRTLPVDLEVIGTSKRRDDAEVMRAFDSVWPEVLGGLFTLASAVTQILESHRLTELPRMADFARVADAVDQIFGVRSLETYLERVKSMAADILESDVVAVGLVEFMDSRSAWSGRAGELLTALKDQSDDKSAEGWPKDATRMSQRLKRLAPVLRARGLDVEQTRSNGKRWIELRLVTGGDQGGRDISAAKNFAQRHCISPGQEESAASAASSYTYELFEGVASRESDKSPGSDRPATRDTVTDINVGGSSGTGVTDEKSSQSVADDGDWDFSL